MDIPIDGTITEFQESLKEKGIQYDAKGSAMYPVGLRCFKGVVEGNDCNIIVSYTKTSKTVYHVKVLMSFDDSQQLYQMFYKIDDRLKREYVCEKEENNGEENQLRVYNDPNGYIALYTMNFYLGYGYTERSLHLEFTDTINSELPDKE